ncbi:putative quinol monooxygenase [Nonomuraea zeae]|uniref:Antibiotic biosynthesis monooxygenase n=1 Tax=Nonomuraea zeae TaxID=1642303 RepID=A0A5S4H0X7_9ACTN|nr:putative quinol monooxygenase [Nonomuraea zeae]TMR38888.1 antibiotic biosynthesis monooxygenase [Nonomuraea zeae]
MPNTLTIVATFVAKPGEEGRLREELTAMIAPPLEEEGCLGYQPYADPGRPGRMILLEEWTDAAALAYHFTLPHFERIAGVLEEILAEPFVLRRLTDIPA